MSTTFYNTFSITISYIKNFGAYLYTGKPNQFPMAPPAGSDSGLRPLQGQSRHWKPIWFSSYITYSKATLASQNLGAFNLKFEMRRTYQFSKRLRALPKFWRTLKQMDMERTECVPKDDFGPA